MLSIKPIDIHTLSQFLKTHYMYPDDEFKLNYTTELLDHISLNLHIGLYHNDDLIGTIAAMPMRISMYGTIVNMIAIDFLCIHMELRGIHIVPILLAEIERLAKQIGYKQAVFTNQNITNSLCSAKYYHYPLKIGRLKDIGFWSSDNNPPDLSGQDINLVPMTDIHIVQVLGLWDQYMAQYDIYPIYTKQEFASIFYNNPFIRSYVVVNSEGLVTDFVSCYLLETKKVDTDECILGAYLYYYIDTSIPAESLIRNLMIICSDIHVFNMLDNIGKNADIIKKCGFQIGTGKLEYHINTSLPGNPKLNIILF